MKKYLWIFLFSLTYIFPLQPVWAQSNYVLPYPTFMPGNILYKPSLTLDRIKKYWYFGNFGQFAYNLKLSDKYLVEAKILFEYNQYLLGYKALKKSDFYFQEVKPYLTMAKNEGKDTSEKEKILKNVALKHQEVLSDIQRKIPNVFNWEPEKDLPTRLYLHKAINESITIRGKT